jgi:hypothetical protein
MDPATIVALGLAAAKSALDLIETAQNPASTPDDIAIALAAMATRATAAIEAWNAAGNQTAPVPSAGTQPGGV